MSLDPSEMLPKVQDMIYRLSWECYRYSGIPIEDCQSQACWIFMETCRKWLPGRGQTFSTYLYYRLSLDLKTFVENTHRRQFIRMTYYLDTMQKNTIPAQNTAYSMWEEFSEDAQEIIQLLIESPAELFGENILSLKKDGLVRHVKEFLHKRGKPKSHIKRAYREIETKLRQAWA